MLECSSDGSFVVTKPPNTGGLVTEATVGEQLLYEIGDPQRYLLPDVVCDFSEVKLEQLDCDRVRVSGCTGQAPSPHYKVCATYEDGFRCMAMMPIVGREAADKGARQAAAVIERCEEMFSNRGLAPFRTTRVETLGAEFSYGPHSRTADSREVLTKIAVEHESKVALKLFAREVLSPTTSMSVGSTGWFLGGRPQPSSVVRLFSFLLNKSEVPVTVDLGAGATAVEIPAGVDAPGGPGSLDPDSSESLDFGSGTLTSVPLIDLAWGRSGDKGNRFNVGVMARRPDFLPWIRRSLTCEFVAQHMQHVFDEQSVERHAQLVERFELPGIHALNFLFANSLGGGGMGSLRLDPLAKGMAQQLLEVEIEIPSELVASRSSR